jgi:hypothetical protein
MHYLIALAFLSQAALPPDSLNRLRGAARSAEARYERLARNLAPVGWGFGGSQCDEIIGRFCLRFDSTSTPPTAAEAGAVIDARRDAVEALRRYFSAGPGERAAAGPLVRLLVLDDRAREAVSAAATFAALSRDSLWGHLLQGLALHAAGESAAAERHFVQALGRMNEEERRDWTEVSWLIDPAERRLIGRLDGPARAEYERRLWLVADPLWLTPPNERWIEHMARGTEARLLSRVPVVTGMLPWGRDLDELTLRYGTPASRSQVRGNRPWDPSNFIEYFDTAQRAYIPPRWLGEGLPLPPLPGDPPVLYSARARSAYALGIVHRVLDLPHQATRFISGSEFVLRIDAAIAGPPESPPDARPQLGLFAYDSAFTRRLQSTRFATWAPDTMRFSMSLRAPPGRIIYSVELLDPVVRFAARARYALDADIPESGPIVSDLLICTPFDGRLPSRRDDPVLRPLHALAVPAGATLGVYAEVYRLAGAGPESLRIEFALEPADRPGLLVQFARWIGRTAGVVRPPTDPRVAWSEEVEDGVHPLAINLPLDARRSGRHVLVLRVTDLRTGRSAETRRPLLIRGE